MMKGRENGKKRSKKKSLFGQKVLARGGECGILLLSPGGIPPPPVAFWPGGPHRRLFFVPLPGAAHPREEGGPGGEIRQRGN